MPTNNPSSIDQNNGTFVFPVWPESFIGNYGTKSNPIIITSLIGNRTLTVNGKTKTSYHCGFDIAVPEGVQIVAPDDCVIGAINTNPDAGSGLAVSIRIGGLAAYVNTGDLRNSIPNESPLGVPTNKERVAWGVANGEYLDVYFMHMSSINSELKRGDWVKKGTVLGNTGNTGRSTGPHLHLQIHYKGQYIMPSQLMKASYFQLSSNNKHLKDAYNVQVADYSMPFSEAKAEYQGYLDERSSNIRTKWHMSYVMCGDLVGCRSVEFAYKDNATEPLEATQPLNTQVNTELMPGIWQIIKLLIDSEVDFRQVVDVSLTNSTGSLLNWFNKVCQKPFVEFMGDTWGDQYYFIVRKPPFDYDSVLQSYQDALYSNNSYLVIHPNQVISSTLTWSVDSAYSWYMLQARVNFMNNSDDVGMLPAVFFPEMAAMFGSRVCNVQSNYVNLVSDGITSANNSNAEVSEKCRNNVIRAHYRCILDLKYLIESTIYAPFTRQGSITIYGDRRIKRGSWIYFVPTMEVYYVESVSNTFQSYNTSVSRTTTLQLSHGMKVRNIEKSYKDGERDDRLPYSYFDIVDFGDESSWEDLSKHNTGYPNGLFEAVSKFKIRKDVLNYFWAKRQMLEQKVNLYATADYED